MVWDCDIFEGRLEDVLANLNFLNFWQAVAIRCFPANFDCSPIDSRTSTNYDNLVYDFSPMTGYFRTNFYVCANRGLWDNLSLPRTIPDKHVELSSVCALCLCCDIHGIANAWIFPNHASPFEHVWPQVSHRGGARRCPPASLRRGSCSWWSAATRFEHSAKRNQSQLSCVKNDTSIDPKHCK